MTLARNILKRLAQPARCRIDIGVRHITVDHIVTGDVNGPNALDWRREAFASVPNLQLAEEAAIAWFDESDQSMWCEVMFRIVDERGNLEFISVFVGPEVVAKAKSRRVLGGGL